MSRGSSPPDATGRQGRTAYARAGLTIIQRALTNTLAAELRKDAAVNAVFPEVETGRRAGLFTIDLSDDLTDEQIASAERPPA